MCRFYDDPIEYCKPLDPHSRRKPSCSFWSVRSQAKWVHLIQPTGKQNPTEKGCCPRKGPWADPPRHYFPGPHFPSEKSHQSSLKKVSRGIITSYIHEPPWEFQIWIHLTPAASWSLLAHPSLHPQQPPHAVSRNHGVLLMSGSCNQGRRPHWAKTIRLLNTLEHTWECWQKSGVPGSYLLWACEPVWMPGGSHIQWPKIMVSLFTEPEPCLLRRAGVSSHNGALDSLSLEPELHGDALVQPFYSFCPELDKTAAAGPFPLPVLKHCHLVVAVALLEKAQRQLSQVYRHLIRC